MRFNVISSDRYDVSNSGRDQCAYSEMYLNYFYEIII